MERNVAISPGPDAKAALRADLAKYYRIAYGTETPPLAARLRVWAENPGLQCVAIYRLGRLAKDLRASRPVAAWLCRGLHRLVRPWATTVHHVWIEAEVGPGLYIGHASNIFIGSTSIGRNFSVTHNVTIGVGHSPGSAGVPSIGDDVWVGTGSVLHGAIRIGDGATIASGTVLARNVPPRSLVGGNPGRVVMTDYDNGRLFGATPEATAGGSGSPAAAQRSEGEAQAGG